MEKLTNKQLCALLIVASGDCKLTNEDLQELRELEKLGYITAWSEFFARSLMKPGAEVVERAITVTPGLSILNEDGPSEDLLKLMDGAIGIVEATSTESMHLWQHYHQEMNKSWVQNSGGYLPTIGWIAGRPVCLSIFANVVDGQKILFIEPTSIFVDHDLIEEWLKKFAPKSCYQKGGVYLNKRDAMNFHCIFPR